MFGFSEAFIGEIFVLLLLIPVLTRPLFKKQKYADSIVMVSPLCIVLSIVLIVVYGLSWSRIITGAFSILVLLTNMRALQRFGSRLYVDYYSLAFRIAAAVETLLIVCTLVVFFFFRPSVPSLYPERTVYTGSFTHGFTAGYGLFRRINLVTYRYGNCDSGKSVQDRPLVVFLPDTYTTAEDSQVRLSACTQKGISVFTGDFYVDDGGIAGGIRGFSSLLLRYGSTKRFFLHHLVHANETFSQEIRQKLIEQRRREAESLLVLAGDFAQSLIIAAEGDSLQTAYALQKKYPLFVLGVFDSSAGLPYYKRGTGDLFSVQPLDAFFMFYKTERGRTGSSFGGTVRRFFALQNEEREKKSYGHFAEALYSYMEGIK
ncbi:hypothetical protein V1L52_00970 [Treponema sp. HNW]|uniref:hypothetical protein n=1 Tax=Treponema sp. HNW TaxID=3116654 RepID=UPI003D0BEA71